MLNGSGGPESDRWSTAWWIRYGMRGAGLLFALAMLGTIWNFAATTADRERVAVENRVFVTLERLLSTARDMETGERGYVLVGSDQYLEPYRASMSSMARAEEVARMAWARGGGRADDLTPAMDTLELKRAITTRVVDARRAQGFEAAQALVASGEGKAIMDKLRVQVAQLQDEVSARRQAIERGDRTRSTVLTVASTIAAILACAYIGWLAWLRRRIAMRTSQELAGLGDRFRTLADNIPQLAWMAEANGRIYWYNQRWYDYTGLSSTDMDNDGWKKVHDPEHVEAVSERFLEAVRTGEPWQDTFPLRAKDGEYRWFLSMAQPIRDAGGEILRWFGTNTDVTAQREQEQQLAAARDAAEDANRAKSQFLANMSHELRTPLSAVIGYSEMLEEEVEELGEKHLLDDLSKIKSNARHLLSLINDVLDISKIEANKMEVFAETFDIATMVREVASTVGSLVEKKANTLTVEAGDELGSMHTDVVKLRQVLINLLSNAAKFTQGGEIVLAARRHAEGTRDDIVFTVRDTGLGMSEEELSRLFQRFAQADVSTTRRFGGTGLGLAITKAFSAMLGGTVSVTSKPGEGSVFEVTVPATLAPEPEDDETLVEVDGADEEVILVIDDDLATRELLGRFLTREGFTVRVAADGRSGLALAQALKPRVIILDVTMPRMDGWEVLRKLKDDAHLAAIPVVMCTVIDEQSLGFSLGASDYVLKPVDWDRLKDVLGRVVKDAPKGDVLVVDDDRDTRERLQGLLAKNGWTVTEAENGRAALDAARMRAPSLVLLDLNMPEMDGFTFLREFRSTPEWVSVPVVVMTARDLTAAERAELKGGDARVFEKGQVGIQELVGQLRTMRPPSPPRPRAPSPRAIEPVSV